MIALYLLGCFLLGSIPNAYLAGRLIKNIDLRQHGSGNVGATNAVRVLGKPVGFAVFALDFLKGAVPTLLVGRFFPEWAGEPLVGLLAGLTAVIGHMFTPFLAFKGGKGIATGGGALCAAYPLLFLVSLAVWVISFSFSRIVSLSSLIAVLALFLSSLLTPVSLASKALFFMMVLLVVWSHRANIERLLKGEEHRFSKSNK